MSVDIKDKIALVTGANRGIGASIVESFFAAGAKKIYAAVRQLDSAKELTEKYGDKLVPVHLDLEKPETIQELAKTAADVQVVVNNAGVLIPATPLADDAEQNLQQELTINTFGLLRVAKVMTPIIESNGGGAFVQLNSVASIKNFLGLTTYSASKAATYSITQGLREELSDKGIAVLSVHPGPIDTNMAATGGMTDIAEPTSVVSEGIVAALKAGDFHLFPDSMAKDFGQAFHSYAKEIIES
ncbi:SDR family oxidoreductase [Pleionea sp. CnH1-48]|uniref:SDR family oxidoreductase n=1 Tax=Pleionea sp. CnH1-48 TaxID=2954494 RepID=UPI002097C289|nr:SDR family oxidoreductase [Pleionea sp. CnH1-48]MCO7224891.1 SDR family oxidoreductase [Pleionea sp. CnH1-48]